MCACMLSRFSCVRPFATLWTVARQAPLSVGFSRQEYWSGLPCPPPGDLPNPEIKPTSPTPPALASGCLTTSATWESLVTPWTAETEASLSFTISLSLFKLMSIESMMSSNHLILCHALLLLLSIFPSIRVFSNESALHIRWPKYWSLNISPSNEYSGLISFRIDWLDLLVVQRTLKSLLQHHSSLKASVLQHAAFFMVQLSHSCMTTGKTMALTTQTFVGKVMSLVFFNTLSRFVRAFLPRSKYLLISWL